ncbi:MAG: carboxypeptidase-like regulatory domain-containing protein, partial [Tannerellaceae bacterium]|nr:carboxypeptidase-like regulatory domain-containing protein [Tannerellaceae bacterium]
MKISIFLLFTCAVQLIAMNSEAQNAIITVASSDITIGELIEEIEQQTDYLVVYSNSEINLAEVLHVQHVSTNVSDLLKDAFADNNLNYKFENDYIILSKRTIHPAIEQTERRITGKITDSSGEPVIGANVVAKGTTNGTVTDMDGLFTLLNVAERATLQVSYIGYLAQEIILSRQTHLNIILLEDARTLEEVVVIGYGTLRKKDLTGSVGQVSSGVLETLATNRIEQALT